MGFDLAKTFPFSGCHRLRQLGSANAIWKEGRRVPSRAHPPLPPSFRNSRRGWAHAGLVRRRRRGRGAAAGHLRRRRAAAGRAAAHRRQVSLTARGPPWDDSRGVFRWLFHPFLGWEGEPPTKKDNRKKVGTLIRFSLLEDLVSQFRASLQTWALAPAKSRSRPRGLRPFWGATAGGNVGSKCMTCLRFVWRALGRMRG